LASFQISTSWIRGRRRIAPRRNEQNDALVELSHPRDPVQVDLLEPRGADLARPPRHRDAHRHQPQVPVHADDAVLARHPFRGVVGDADDEFQVRRFARRRPNRRAGCRTQQGKAGQDRELVVPHLGGGAAPATEHERRADFH
jgi:hypothetical protein